MEATLITKQVAVYDDVLPQQDLSELLTWFNTLPFDYVHHIRDAHVQKVWRPHDGQPMKGPEFPLRKSGEIQTASHPSFEKLMLLLQQCLPQTPVGVWELLNATMWVYPPGSGLSLHTDGGGHSSGSFVYFLHPEWRLHWGGLLLVLDEETEGEDPATEGIVCPWLLDDDENRRVWSPGYGRVILPKPNRMVFLSRDAQHSVTAVTQGVRLSVGGFFRHPRVVRM